MSEEVVDPVAQQRAAIAEHNSEPVAPASETTAQNAPPSEPATETPTDVESGGEADPEQQEADKAIKRGKNYYARKIDQLTREREQERTRAEQAMRLLERQIAERQPVAPQAQGMPNAGPQREQFASYEDYLEARSDWKAQQTAAAMHQRFVGQLSQQAQYAQAQQQATQLAQTFQQRLDEGRKAHADWDDVIAEAGDMPVGNAGAAIAQTEKPADVIYWLGKNPDVLRRIASMPPMQAAIEVGRISANLGTKPAPSNAPAPGKPANARGNLPGGIHDGMSMQEFVAARRKAR